MNLNTAPTSRDSDNRRSILALAGLLVVVIGFLFSSSLKPGQALFANDGPLGSQQSEIYRLPGAFFGIWNDLYWVGAYNGNYSPNVTGVLLWLLGPIPFNKFYVPTALLILGLSAGYFFRRLKFETWVCVLAGVAAALNSNFFSNSAWGLASRALSLAATFWALTALQAGFSSRSTLRALLLTVVAGLGIGMSISEGADNGAIFSMFVAGFAFLQNLTAADGSAGQRVAKGIARVAIMAVFAAFLAAQTLNIFVTTSVKGIVGVEQAGMSPEQKWDWATQWSLPKMETLRVIIPGLFGYRLDTEKGGNYWGKVGQQPGWEVHHQGFSRHSGAGEYAGVLVVLVAFWAVVFSFRKGRPLTMNFVAADVSPLHLKPEEVRADSRRLPRFRGNGSGTQWNASLPQGPFTDTERKMIWYWAAAGLVALVLAWGRHAPFYALVYHLPFFSTIRNPMKFMHPVHLCLMVLFAYGLQGLSRLYLDRASAAAGGLFEKRWTYGMFGAVVLSAVAFLLYANAQESLVKHLLEAGFGDPALAKQIAKFSASEVGLFVVFFAASAAIVWLIQSGAMAGKRAIWAALLLGTVLVVDLCRANAPWIIYYNWRDKYASNPVLDFLREKPFEQRVSILPFPLDRLFSFYQQVYQVEWMQHHFPFYGIQSLDIPQEPRMPADKAAYRLALLSGQLFAAEDFIDLPSLSGRFQKKSDPLSTFLGQKISPGTVRLLESALAGTNANNAADNLAGDLNRLIRSENIYRPERFAGIKLPEGVSNLLARASLSPEETVSLNRTLLELAYPKEINKSPGGSFPRLWELTNTRYICGLSGGIVDQLNAQFDPVKRRFRPAVSFDFDLAGPDQSKVKSTNAAGKCAVLEFGGALPRVKLYSQWQVITNDDITLGKLPRASFDPAQTVLIADEIPAPAAGATNTAALKAEITSYAPKKLTVRTSSPATPTVLLLNDKWDEGWSVTVDGKPAPLLRANFLMQAVALPAGEHTVQFTFAPRSTIFFISLAAVLLGILLCGLLFIFREPREENGNQKSEVKGQRSER